VRKLYIRTERLSAAAPYRVTTQATSVSASNIDLHGEYSIGQIDDPSLKLLLIALRQQPRDPGELIRTALEDARLQPSDVATKMVLTLPKQSGQLMQLLVQLYPERRLAIARSLQELFSLRKERINSLIEEGLVAGASDAEAAAVRALVRGGANGRKGAPANEGLGDSEAPADDSALPEQDSPR